MNNKTGKIVIIVLVVLAVLVALLALTGNKSATATTSFSQGLDKNGMFKDVKALDYVTLPEYKGITVEKADYEATEEDVDLQIQTILDSYESSREVTDRAIEAGDMVCINYVGKMDGVEFEGGKGENQLVTAGSNEFVDDFLYQIIGHMPGETMDVEVTFPTPYQNNPDFEGKDAVFTVDLNYIKEPVAQELTDAWVAETYAEQGYKTVADLKDGIKKDMEENAVLDYLHQYLLDKSVVTEIPQQLLDYQKESLRTYYQSYGQMFTQYYGGTYEDFLGYYGFESEDALLESMSEDIENSAKTSLVYQAVAEKENIKPTDEDVKNYFLKSGGSDDISQYETTYGKPYLMNIALCSMVQDLIRNSAVVK